MRLSKEDLDKGNAESESIQNQRMILDEYASSHGWEIYGHYIDEDFSGSDRSRPDFNRMIEDAKNGKFNIVLVKTQSRFARDIKVVEDYIHNLFKEKKPQICLMGATSIGRDLGPRVSSALHSGLTADCTALEIGSHEDKKAGKSYENLLYQIRPAFGGNIVATIVNPECRPQMATVREGVMKKEIVSPTYKGEVVKLDASKYVSDTDFVVSVIERQIEKSKINIKSAPIIVAGGYGVGSKENFKLLYDLAATIGAEVGASRAAVDAGYAEHERQIGQTGVTVRPKLYIACGISGQIQHIAGMQDSSMIIAINNDPNAPINTIADYVITGTVEDILPKMIKYYKKNSK